MTEMLPDPWTPDRAWADPFIVTLALLIVVLVGSQTRLRKSHPSPPPSKVSLQGKLLDLGLAAPKLLGAGGPHVGQPSLASRAHQAPAGWDQALLAIAAAENQEPTLAQTLAASAPGPLGETFRRAWRYAYRQEGPAPSVQERAQVRAALGDGYAARVLEARVEARAGADPAPLLEAARQWALPRMAVLGLVTMGGLLLALAGTGFGIFLVVRPARPQALPSYGMSGRAVLIVLLGWFLTLLAAGPVVAILVGLFPFLRPIGLPLVYGFHASLGTFYLCRAEGLSLGALTRRLLPARPGPALAHGLGFFALAFASVMAVSLVLSPLLRHAESPQKELLDLLMRQRGPLAVTLLFLTVAVLAPIFEELLFRGFLLPWLDQRLQRFGRRGGWLALAVTALTFGAMHLQPWGLPTLSCLGLILGLAYRRTGHLGSAILVHGLWNGGVFLAMRLLAA